MSKPINLRHEDELYYKAGETDTFRVVAGGFVTSSKTAFYLMFPLNKDATGLDINVLEGSMVIRSVEGEYVVRDVSILEDTSISIINNGRSIVLQIAYNTPKNIINNTPVSIDITDLTLKFS